MTMEWRQQETMTWSENMRKAEDNKEQSTEYENEVGKEEKANIRVVPIVLPDGNIVGCNTEKTQRQESNVMNDDIKLGHPGRQTVKAGAKKEPISEEMSWTIMLDQNESGKPNSNQVVKLFDNRF